MSECKFYFYCFSFDLSSGIDGKECRERCSQRQQIMNDKITTVQFKSIFWHIVKSKSIKAKGRIN